MWEHTLVIPPLWRLGRRIAVNLRLVWATQSDTLSQKKKSENKKEEKDNMVD